MTWREAVAFFCTRAMWYFGFGILYFTDAYMGWF